MAELTPKRRLVMALIGIACGVIGIVGWNAYKDWRGRSTACATLFSSDEIERWSQQHVTHSYGGVKDNHCSYTAQVPSAMIASIPEALVTVEISPLSYESGVGIWAKGKPQSAVPSLGPKAITYPGLGGMTEVLVGVTGGVLRVTLASFARDTARMAPFIEAMAARGDQASAFLADR